MGKAFSYFILVIVAALTRTLLGCFYLISWLIRQLRKRVEGNPCVNQLDEKFVVVTGCDTGFGRELATQLWSTGLKVFAGCLTPEAVEYHKGNVVELSKENKRNPKDFYSFQLDVTSDTSVKAAVSLIRGTIPTGKGLWALVNNAAILGAAAPDDWLSVSDYEAPMNVNVMGTIRVTQALKELLKVERGRIVFMVSVAGYNVIANAAPYCISKFALVGYCECLRLEMADFNVEVIQVVPGLHKTNILVSNLNEDVIRGIWARLPSELKLQYNEDFLKKRLQYQEKFLELLTICNHFDVVVNTCVQAVTAKYPEDRYWVGLDSNFYFRWFRHFPPAVSVWHNSLIRNVFGDGFTRPLEAQH